ncbi:hypothetical protein ACYSNX_02555 [Myroides sp. LJL115]
MILKYILFIVICVLGECFVALHWFKYLKRKFAPKEGSNKQDVNSPDTLLCLNISTFKGVMERLIIAICLAIGVTPILIVFGALKIGTRLKSPDDKIQNDYFLVGNLSSIFIAVVYVYIFNKSILLL